MSKWVKPADYQPVKYEAPAKWAELLDKCLSEPGTISGAFRSYYSYSIGNQLMAAMQMVGRRLPVGPIANYRTWQANGRQVRKGEKALVICRPVTIHKSKAEPGQDADADASGEMRTIFVWKPLVFGLPQTDPVPGKEYTEPAPVGWDKALALAALGVAQQAFDLTDGTIGGYATGNRVTVNGLFPDQWRVLWHEVAHVLLHTGKDADKAGAQARGLQEVEAEATSYIVAEALGYGDCAGSRAYVQHWLGENDLPDRNARRIFSTADKILKAGRPTQVEQEESTAA